MGAGSWSLKLGSRQELGNERRWLLQLSQNITGRWILAALFTTAQRQKQPEHPVTDEQTHTAGSLHTVNITQCEKEGHSDTCRNVGEP